MCINLGAQDGKSAAKAGAREIPRVHKMKKEELEELLEEYEDHSSMFPHGDEYDGSHEWD